jgi:PadR family transcriptional regulator PadR
MGSNLDDWQGQVRRGVLELCVLALLKREPSYGYDLVSKLSGSKLEVSEGTLYPLLRRLRRDGFLEAYWQESDAGPPRQYYRLTNAGRTRLNALAAEWRGLTNYVQTLFSGESQ